MASTAPEEPATAAVLADPVPPRPRLNPGWGLVLLGGVLGVLGAFLTWATVDYGGLATHTYRGVSGGRDGKITVVLAVLALGVTAAAFLGWYRRWTRPALTVLGLLIAFVAIADLAASPSVGSQEKARLKTSAQITSSNGIGEWLTLIAGILIVVGVVLAGRYARPRAAGAHAGRPASDAVVPSAATAEEPVQALSADEPAREPETAAQVDSGGSEPATDAAPRDGDSG